MACLKKAGVSPNHKRAIGTALALFDQMLCGFERIAYGEENHGVMYRERNTLSDEQRASVLTEVAHIRPILQELRSVLGLEVRVEDLGRKVWGSGSAFWEVLLETETRHLRRYGDTPPELKDYLDPKVETLIEHLVNITKICERDWRGLRTRPEPADDAGEHGKEEKQA